MREGKINNRIRRHSSGGFTLVEIIFVIVIVALMMTTSYSTLSGIIKTKHALDDRRDVKAVVNSILGRLTRELQLSQANATLIHKPNDQPYLGRIWMKGETSQLSNGQPGDSITFVALEGGQYVPDGETHTGLVQITYRIAEMDEPAPNGEKLFQLIREEIPYRKGTKDVWDKAMIFPVAENVVSLKFRYLQTKTGDWRWSEKWGDDQVRFELPDLIEFSVVLRSPRGTMSRFTSSIALAS